MKTAAASPLAKAGLASLIGGGAVARDPAPQLGGGKARTVSAHLKKEDSQELLSLIEQANTNAVGGAPQGAAQGGARPAPPAGLHHFKSAARAVGTLRDLFELKEPKVQVTKVHKCPHCAYVAATRAALRKHAPKHLTHKCAERGCTSSGFATELELYAHACAEHPQPQSCAICGVAIQAADAATAAAMASAFAPQFCPICSVMHGLVDDG
jgi:hypothetical protein